MSEAATTTTPATGTPAAEQQTNPAASNPAAEQPQVDNNSKLESLIQSAVDRATNKLGNENKQLRKQLEALQKEKLSDDEIKDLELKEREKTLADRDKALTEKENRWIAMKAIKEAGLDDGSDAALAIVDFVMAEDETAIKERVKAFDALVKGIVKSQVDAVFKASGRTPGVGSDTAANAGGEHDYATRSGKNAAAATQKSRSILDSYGLGGK